MPRKRRVYVFNSGMLIRFYPPLTLLSLLTAGFEMLRLYFKQR